MKTAWESSTAEYVYRECPKARLIWDQSIGQVSLDVEGTSGIVKDGKWGRRAS
jgi:hypothetical protein